MLAIGDAVDLAPDDARKLAVVLRATPGDAIEVVDSGGRSFAAELVTSAGSPGGLRATLRRELATLPPPALEIVLAQGIPKGAKMDFVVEKATELGVSRVSPFASERTVGEGERTGKLERWRRLARTAAQQCGRADVPAIDAPQSFARIAESFASYDLALVPWEVAEPVAFRDALPGLLSGARRAIVAIGPEGGFTRDEIALAERSGARIVSLGRRILRTETAGLVAVAALRYASGEL